MKLDEFIKGVNRLDLAEQVYAFAIDFLPHLQQLIRQLETK